MENTHTSQEHWLYLKKPNCSYNVVFICDKLKSSDLKAQKCSQTYVQFLKHVSDSRLLYF